MDALTHFLTYADNYAIGYFKKQGFTKQVSSSRVRGCAGRQGWFGWSTLLRTPEGQTGGPCFPRRLVGHPSPRCAAPIAAVPLAA